MRSARLWLARHRVDVAMPFALLLALMAQPAAAAGDPQADVSSAASALHSARARVNAEDGALRSAEAALIDADAHLAALQARIHTLDTAISVDSARVRILDAHLDADRGRLSAYLRTSYEQGGSAAALVYLISANTIADAIERKVQLDHVAVAVQNMIARIRNEAGQASSALGAARRARAQLQVAREQAVTEQAVVAAEQEAVTVSDTLAHVQASQAQRHLSAAEAALAAAERARQEAARAARTHAQHSHRVFRPVRGSTFTVDTNLTLRSGETAARLNAFLQGTDLAGLGQSFMRAEAAYHVSARYFVAHAILESDWGASAIAQDKHNLFGYNADDANPYVDATAFPSFDACIQHVARFVSVNYLSPSGRFYHGPTLRGMNVDYASDPDWAFKIAAIADTIP